VAIEVARRAIAPMSAHAAGGHRWARTRGLGVTWVTADPLGMHGLTRVGARAALSVKILFESRVMVL
jgi:hypothetical protein